MGPTHFLLLALSLLCGCSEPTAPPATNLATTTTPTAGPNRINFTTKPRLRRSDPATHSGISSWLEFDSDGTIFSAMWEGEAPDPIALDPDQTYEFELQYLGWHISDCQVLTIRPGTRPGSRPLWSHAEPWQ